MELAAPGVHLVLRTQDVLKTPISNGLLYTTEKFHDNNPKTYKVVLESLQEALDAINADKRTAAAQYLEITKEKVTVDQVVNSISDPEVQFTLTPHSVYTFASFMHHTGVMKALPPSWKDFFFAEAHGLAGE
jgi:NitT/TauT family transport system substrate-binding protein